MLERRRTRDEGRRLWVRRGFTFVELLIVLAIIVVLSGITFPLISRNFSALQLEGFAGDLQALMNYLRQRALAQSQVIYLVFDQQNNQCWAAAKDAPGRLKTCTIPSGIKLESDQAKISFYPDGQIQEAEVNIFSGDKKITLTTKGVYGGVKVLR